MGKLTLILKELQLISLMLLVRLMLLVGLVLLIHIVLLLEAHLWVLESSLVTHHPCVTAILESGRKTCHVNIIICNIFEGLTDYSSE